MLDTLKKPAVVVCLVVIVLIIIVAGCSYLMNEQFGGYPRLAIANMNCNVFLNSPSSDYSATIIDERNADTTADAVSALIQKYGGEIVSRSSYPEVYHVGSKTSDSVTVKTITIGGSVPLVNADAFMKDLGSLATGANATLEDVSYNKTSGDETVQKCVDAENSARIAEATAKVYLRYVVPFATKGYKIETSTDMSNLMSNLQDLNDQIQNFYDQVSSYNDSIALLRQSANIVNVSVTVQDRENPVPYYPPTTDSQPM
ncbi:MAG: hypothetical protein ABSC29_03005 [Minisyncoccia bacterium]|jgi:hypothetical protein